MPGATLCNARSPFWCRVLKMLRHSFWPMLGAVMTRNSVIIATPVFPLQERNVSAVVGVFELGLGHPHISQPSPRPYLERDKTVWCLRYWRAQHDGMTTAVGDEHSRVDVEQAS